MMEDEERKRREAALAAAPALQPDFESSKVTQDQIDKLKELRKRRLQIKSKSNSSWKRVKANGSGTTKARDLELAAKSIEGELTIVTPPEVDVSPAKSCQQQKEEASSVPMRRQKLHWGLDTKERWERKANM